MSPIGERIRAMRQSAGLSQTDLAGDQLSPSYVSLIEAGKRQPSPAVLRVLADRLNCRMEDLELGPQSQERQYVDLEISYAKLAMRNGETRAAHDRLARLIEMPDVDEATLDDARYLLAIANDQLNDPVTAAIVIQPVYERALAQRSHFAITRVASTLSWFYTSTGDLNTARRVAESGLSAADAQGLVGTAEYFNLAVNMLNICYELGDLTYCTILGEQLLQLAQGAQPREQGLVYWHAALVAEAQGKISEAVGLCERALAVMAEGSTQRELPRLRVEAATILLRSEPGRVNDAMALLDRALTDLADLGSPSDLAMWEYARARGELFLGRPAQAEQLARQALLHSNPAPTWSLARIHLVLGDALTAGGGGEALGSYHAAREILRNCTVSRQAATVWRELADRLALAGDQPGATAAYVQALDSSGIRGDVAAARMAFGIEPLPTPTSPPASRPDSSSSVSDSAPHAWAGVPSLR
jgi:transcriptional regulator with XRE-family HTH domain